MEEKVGSFVIEGKGKNKQVVPNTKDDAMAERKCLDEKATKTASAKKGVKDNVR